MSPNTTARSAFTVIPCTKHRQSNLVDYHHRFATDVHYVLDDGELALPIPGRLSFFVRRPGRKESDVVCEKDLRLCSQRAGITTRQRLTASVQLKREVYHV